MTTETEDQVLFREVQYLRQPWLWALILAGSGLAFYAIIQLLLLDESFGDNTAANISILLVGSIIGVGVPALMFMTHLITEVRQDALYYRYFPFHTSLQRIPFDQIESFEAITYNPIRDYGGWGIRYWLKGKAYSARGNKGVRFVLTGGARVLIGSQRPEELARSLEAAGTKA